MSSRPILQIVALWGLVAAQLVAQQSPSRDSEFKPTSGTASVTGAVVIEAADGTRQPGRRTVVTIAGAELRPSRGAITDDAGRFTFTNLPAGRFTITAARTSFITSQFGAKRPGRPGTAVAVADGQQLSNVTVRLWPGAVISGILRDERGDPVEGVAVTAIPERPRGPEPTLTLTNNGTETNDRGEYRIFGLEPGTYVIVAKPQSAGLGQIAALAEAELDAAFEALKRRTSQPATAKPPAPVRPGDLFDYAPVYFPGTAFLESATRITLTAGQERGSVDFAIQRVPTSTVSGTVLDLTGKPVPGVGVRLVAAAAATFATDAPATFAATTAPDGTFSIGQVAPGDYKLHVRAAAEPIPETPGRVSINPTVPLLWGLVDLSINGNDVAGLAVNLQSALTVSGRLIFEPGASAPPADLTTLRVTLNSTTQPRGGVAIINGVAQGNVVMPIPLRADGTFELRNITPDTYRVFVSGAPLTGTEWWLKSAVLGGRDAQDHFLTIGPGANVPGAVLTMSDRKTELSGRLETPAGAPVADVFVLAYASDRALWGGTWRRVQAVRPGVDGRYVIRGLPPGDYLIAALTDVDQDEWQDAAFLESLISSSIKITLGDGQKTTQDLRLGR